MKKYSFFLFIVFLFGCTEPYLLQTSDFEEALVVEATLTNEFKKQQIKLSKTYRLEASGPEFIADAEIFIEDDMGNTYNFIEGNQVYESENEFQAVANRKYKLTIKTGGKTYTSTQETLTTVNPIQSVEVSDQTINNVRGAEIKVKAFDPTNSSKYYRYEFEETYKIIAPRTSPVIGTVSIVSPINELILTPRGPEEIRVCYSTELSNEILLQTTSNLSEDRINYTVRFIPVTNPIIMHRYSILVRQYIQNLAAFTYYSTLKKLSGDQSILSQNQPGFFSGNIKCDSNINEKVIGFFDVSTVSSERIFFNFVDVFPNTNLPDYFFDCYENCLEVDPFKCDGAFNFCFAPGASGCQGNLVKSYLNAVPQRQLYIGGPNPIYLVPPPCGDCTTFSSNVVPPFWQ
jgi:hypothetical protein